MIRSCTLLLFALCIGFAGCASSPTYDGRPDSLAEAGDQLMQQAWAAWRTSGGLREAVDATELDRQVRIAVVDWRIDGGADLSRDELQRELRHQVASTPRCRYVAPEEVRALVRELDHEAEAASAAGARAWQLLSQPPATSPSTPRIDMVARATIRRRGERLVADLEIVDARSRRQFSVRGEVLY
ncbi:MAG: hypothetical protein ACE37K_26080 [Planctomycetota bacterium]